jgi:hypothetical protein
MIVGGKINFRVPELAELGPMPQLFCDAQLDEFDAVDGSVFDAELSVSANGLHYYLPAILRDIHIQPTPVRGISWSDVYRAHGLPEIGTVPVAGAINVILEWMALMKLDAAAPRRRGQPKRTERWDEDREELFALILQRLNSDRGEKLVHAIESAAKLEPKRFKRAFKGRTQKAKLELARQYFYARKRELR